MTSAIQTTLYHPDRTQPIVTRGWITYFLETPDPTGSSPYLLRPTTLELWSRWSPEATEDMAHAFLTAMPGVHSIGETTFWSI